MRRIILSLSFIFSFSAFALQDLECIEDSRPRDGDLVGIKIHAENDGKFNVLYTYIEGGETIPPHHSNPPVIDKVVASGLTCIASKFDPRIRECSDDKMAQAILTTFSSRSRLKVAGNDVTHVMDDSLELELHSPSFPQSTLAFATRYCKLLP